jgi:transcription elongation factor GreA
MQSGDFDGQAITPEGLAALKAELAELEGPGRRRMAERILAARELGDLKENAEYHIAKDDQAHLETKIKRLREHLRNAVVVEGGADDEGRFAFGLTAEVVDEQTGAVNRWTIVGPTEADVSQGKLSAQSPVSKALIGQKVGAVVEVQAPGGTRRFRIARLV